MSEPIQYTPLTLTLDKRYIVEANSLFLLPKVSPTAASRLLHTQQSVSRLLVELGHVFNEAHELYIGSIANTAIYVYALIDQFTEDSSFGRWASLRDMLGYLDSENFQLYSRASQLINWQKQHRFCGACGTQTILSDTELANICPTCESTFYPRISPCVIGLVTKGDYCLLGRSHRMPEGFYSALAGFIEVGESVEQAFEREVLEEVGVKIKNIQYFGSQCWPFPSQLMIGFTAQWNEGDIILDDEEMEDANWYHIESLPPIPPEQTISGQIIRAFKGGAKGK